ncbi:conserved hypothetical protein [Ricinus communis]|uniref:Uncharacterized protein n=2 Tax=Ricinus communis TaxID=3988 RepID=B9TCE4_RICCO|nr:conserved hypothetical protein [Ricinus communis]
MSKSARAAEKESRQTRRKTSRSTKIKLEFEDERERGNSKPPAPEQASDGGVVEMVSRELLAVPVLENREELKKTMIHQWEATKTRIRRVRYRKNILLEYKEAWNKGELDTPHGVMISVNRGKFEYILVFEADLKRTTFQNAAEFAEEASYAAFLRDIS